MRLRGFSHALGRIPIDLLRARRLFLAAGGHLTGACEREREERRVTLVSGPPREPQEREAAPEVVPDPGSCSWTREGNAWGGWGRDGWGVPTRITRWGRGVAMVIGKGGVRSESPL